MSNTFVVCMGMSIVFIGLISIVLLCIIMSSIFKLTEKNKEKKETKVIAASPTVPQPIANRSEIIAAISAVIAEELGTDISAIRILSFKKI